MMEPKRLWMLFTTTTLVLFIGSWPTKSEGCLEQERIALLQLKSFFDRPCNLKNWVNSNCCEWERVECNITSGRVIGLYLNSTRAGFGYLLNASLFLPFKELRTLHLTRNQIPDFVDNQVSLSSAFRNLEILVLSMNRFNDTILSKLNSLTKLKILDLSYNNINSLRYFQGKKAQPMMNLEVLDLSDNLLKNSDLAYLNGLSSLKSLNLEFNQLHGSIDIGVLNNLTKLKTLTMSNNEIESLQSFHDGERQLKLMDLEELDLFSNSFNNSLLTQLSGLSNLKYLNVGNNKFKGSINIEELTNALSNLEKIDFSNNAVEFVALNNKENTSLGKLKVAILDGVIMDETTSLIQFMETFSSVKTLYLRYVYFNDAISTQDQRLHVSSKVEELVLEGSHLHKNFLQSIGAMTSLKALSLYSCGLYGTLPTQGWCDLRKLELLDLSENELEGTLPPCLANLSSLHYLDLSGNQFTGNVPSIALANLTLLRYVFLSRNLFEVPSFLTSFANHSHLTVLSTDQNELVKEPILQTWVPRFQLKVFRFSNCKTKELNIEVELPKFLYYQYDLRIIDLSNNHFGGEIPSWLLQNNTRMEAFLLKGNSFMGHLQLSSHPNPNMALIDISGNKIQGRILTNICSTFPHLRMVNFSDNNLEGNIPPCLGSLNTTYLYLDLSNNHFSGEIPEDIARSNSLSYLRLSNNNLSGEVSPVFFGSYSLEKLFLDGNKFDGGIPDVDISDVRFSLLRDIDLSNNSLSGQLPKWIWNLSDLRGLALSDNRLEGSLPMELCYLDYLEVLDLSQNQFSGPIPSCFDAHSIIHLHLSRNRLNGTLKSAFLNSYSLVTLDISENQFTGGLPLWLGSLSALSVLLLRANYFIGEIPKELCRSYSLSIIDLSHNKLFGSVPSCLSNLTLEPNDSKTSKGTDYGGLFVVDEAADYFGMTELEMYALRGSDETTLSYSYDNQMEPEVDYTTKKESYKYRGNILDYMSGIDLSCNGLTGEIPLELGNLTEIRSLNLSHNNLTGLVPSTFSKLKQIESLDLSHNNLTGRIPVELEELNALAVFHVSYNNLSGSIPPPKAQFATFDESSYVGNPFLCGLPLHKSCDESDSSITKSPNDSDDEEESGSMDMYVFWVTFCVCYVIVLLVIAAILYINPYWRRTWFYFIEHCIKTCQYFVEENLLHFSIFRR